MFLVAEVEVKEHCLPRFSWSSNTILCVGVSSSECRLCILHSLEFPTYSMLLTDSFAEKTAFPASSTCSWDLVLPIFVWLFIVHISFDSVEDGSRIPCKDSKQMINTVLFRGSIRNTDGEDFLLLSVFTAPLTSGVRWHQSGCWHELSRHHSMRAEPHLTDSPLPTCSLAGSTVLIFGAKSWKLQKLKASTSAFFLQADAKLMLPLFTVRHFAKIAGADTWGESCHWQSNLLDICPAASACELEAAVHWKTPFGL